MASLPDFGGKYAAHMVERVRASGATPDRVEATRREAMSFKEMYDKPLMNAALTFTEPFPIGLVVSLISAGIWRRRVG